jgi:hypothetical protein
MGAAQLARFRGAVPAQFWQSDSPQITTSAAASATASVIGEQVWTSEKVSFMTEETAVKLFGLLGAILVIMGSLGVSRPLSTETAALSDRSAPTLSTQGNIAQVLGGAAIITGFALVWRLTIVNGHY